MRRGLGKAKHISVQYLWLQGRVDSGDLVLMKVSTEKNLADLFTKPLTKLRVSYLLRGLGYMYSEGRAERAPWLEVDTDAISKASPMLALTVLAMRIGCASGSATATADDADLSTSWLLWIVVLASMLLGATTLSVVMPCAMAVVKGGRRAIGRLLAEAADASTQTRVEAVTVSANRGPDHIIATSTDGCYHADYCKIPRDPWNTGLLRKGVRFLRRCEVCG